jgi:hypothetical protein
MHEGNSVEESVGGIIGSASLRKGGISCLDAVEGVIGRNVGERRELDVLYAVGVEASHDVVRIEGSGSVHAIGVRRGSDDVSIDGTIDVAICSSLNGSDARSSVRCVEVRLNGISVLIVADVVGVVVVGPRSDRSILDYAGITCVICVSGKASGTDGVNRGVKEGVRV